MTSDQERWNQRYRGGAYSGRAHPSAYLASLAPRLAAQSDGHIAVDLACGRGRNTRYLASLGFAAVGVDVSDVGLTAAAQQSNSGTEPRWICRDLLADPLEVIANLRREIGAPAALVCVFRFDAAGLVPHLHELLAPNGTLIMETHLRWPQPVSGPSGARFRLPPDHWRNTLSDELHITEYFEGLVREPDGDSAAVVRVSARRL